VFQKENKNQKDYEFLMDNIQNTKVIENAKKDIGFHRS